MRRVVMLLGVSAIFVLSSAVSAKTVKPKGNAAQEKVINDVAAMKEQVKAEKTGTGQARVEKQADDAKTKAEKEAKAAEKKLKAEQKRAEREAKAAKKEAEKNLKQAEQAEKAKEKTAEETEKAGEKAADEAEKAAEKAGEQKTPKGNAWGWGKNKEKN